MHKIGVDELNTWLIDANEAILSKYLSDFIFLNLREKGVEPQAFSRVFYAYLKESKQYFIAHFIAQKESGFIEPQILQAYYFHYESFQNQTDIFILNDYFALFKNQELLFFKPIKQKVSNAQIRNFVEKSLQFKIDNCIEISPKQQEAFQNEFISNYKQLKHINILKNNNFKELKRFIGICIASICLTLGAYLYESKLNNKPIEQKEIKYYPKKELLTKKLVLLIKNINLFSLNLVEMDFKNQVLYLNLKHQNKQNLIGFLTHYQGKIKTLNYNAQESIYELNASFKLI